MFKYLKNKQMWFVLAEVSSSTNILLSVGTSMAIGTTAGAIFLSSSGWVVAVVIVIMVLSVFFLSFLVVHLTALRLSLAWMKGYIGASYRDEDFDKDNPYRWDVEEEKPMEVEQEEWNEDML